VFFEFTKRIFTSKPILLGGGIAAGTAQAYQSISDEPSANKVTEKNSPASLSLHSTDLLNQRHDADSVDAADLEWKCAPDGTILQREQRNRMAHVLNVVIDVDGFTEEEEEILFEHAVREMELALVKGLPTLMLSRVVRKHGFKDLPDFLEANIVRLLEKETNLPFLSLDDQHRVFRSFSVFIRESMREGNSADTVLAEIEKLVANVLMRGTCVLLEPDKRGALVEKIVEDLAVPVVPGSLQRLVLRRVVDKVAGHLEDAFAGGFEAYSKLQAEGRVGRTRLSALIRRRWQERLLRDMEIPFLSRSTYEGLLERGLSAIIQEILDEEGLDSAGDLSQKLKEEEEKQQQTAGLVRRFTQNNGMMSRLFAWIIPRRLQ